MLTAIKASVIQFDTKRTIFYLDCLWVVTVMSEFPKCSRLLPPSWWFQEMGSDCSHLVSCKTSVNGFGEDGFSPPHLRPLWSQAKYRSWQPAVLTLVTCLRTGPWTQLCHHRWGSWCLTIGNSSPHACIQCWEPSVPMVTLIVAWPHYQNLWMQSFSTSLSWSLSAATSI